MAVSWTGRVNQKTEALALQFRARQRSKTEKKKRKEREKGRKEEANIAHSKPQGLYDS